MIHLQHKDLLDAGVHFGHLTSKWHPHMAPFIFMKRNGIHIIDLNKTLLQLQEASRELKVLARNGKRILFVATKKQAKKVVEQEAQRIGMPYVTERWLGGTLTNFVTIRRLIRKLIALDKLIKEPAYQNRVKKEQLVMVREKAKLERLLQGITDTTRLPAALIVVDIKREQIAVREAQKLGITVFALIDTNSDPDQVGYPIPSNDDSSRSIELIIKTLGSAIKEGLEERESYYKENKQEQEQATLKRAKKVVKVASSEEKIKQPVSPPLKEATPRVVPPATPTMGEQVVIKKVTAQAADKALQDRITEPSTPIAVTSREVKRESNTKTAVAATPPTLLSQEKTTETAATKKGNTTSQAKATSSSAKPKADDTAAQKTPKKEKATPGTDRVNKRKDA